MSEPSNISVNVAPIYSADLLYEQNCKCGQTEVVVPGDSWDYTTLGDKAWKIVCLVDTEINTIACSNMSSADTNKMSGVTYVAGTEIMAAVESLVISDGIAIIYKDCRKS